jgi:hypothetical protein
VNFRERSFHTPVDRGGSMGDRCSRPSVGFHAITNQFVRFL